MFAYMHFHHMIPHSSLSDYQNWASCPEFLTHEHTVLPDNFPWSCNDKLSKTNANDAPSYDPGVMIFIYWTSSSFDRAIHIAPLHSKAQLYIIIMVEYMYFPMLRARQMSCYNNCVESCSTHQMIPTETWHIFGPTIEYIAIHSALTENVSIT